MKDIWNPTKEEILKWAYDKSACPDQDWELAVYSVENIYMIIDFVRDPKCPKRRFFLSCLYVFVGDTIRRNREQELEKLQEILVRASAFEEKEIKDWVGRSYELMLHPEKYEYKYWGLGSEYIRMK